MRLPIRSALTTSRLRLIALALMLVGTSAAWLGVRGGETTTLPELIRAGKLPAQLGNVPSHNRRYRASLLPSQDAAHRNVTDWQLQLVTFEGARVSDAALEMEAWMPEQVSLSRVVLRAISDGHGAYRVEGLRLDRPGWWNVTLGVKRSGITDSLAFNLIVP